MDHVPHISPYAACAPYNRCMSSTSHTLRSARAALVAGRAKPSELTEEALSHSNGNASANTYLWQDRHWTLAEAARAEAMLPGAGGAFGDGRNPLWGVPVSVKDCFDLEGSPTSSGTKFYRDHGGIMSSDSWLVERLRAAGAVITGKTHLHPLAYGITGENPDFGDCRQPGNPEALTGGSSSGAAASVLEGSSIAAIGTDTGGSIRTPAALCGLVGYRASLGRGDWRGGAHLAKSFDTMGWLFRDLEDTPLLADFFSESAAVPVRAFTRFAFVDSEFLHDCEPEIVAAMHSTITDLEALGLRAQRIDVGWWNDAFQIYAPIQAFEAARIHAGNFEHIEPALRERLESGARIAAADLDVFHRRHREFRARIDDLLATHELLLLPASPVARLPFGVDHSRTRPRLLRYTTPFSLGGVPVVTVPTTPGGVQFAAARGSDEGLAALVAQLGAQRRESAQNS